MLVQKQLRGVGEVIRLRKVVDLEQLAVELDVPLQVVVTAAHLQQLLDVDICSIVSCCSYAECVVQDLTDRIAALEAAGTLLGVRTDGSKVRSDSLCTGACACWPGSEACSAAAWRHIQLLLGSSPGSLAGGAGRLRDPGRDDGGGQLHQALGAGGSQPADHAVQCLD